ncbi:putative maltose permease [Jaminaea rosea]|uniref:Putative maltose permease n=1 Tax=Jaminaea rosea TaxID=1569628 RepID=A0A316V459_9BASI|nr:putative maltose permease [Jaminaea rosea]PWN30235.1 putative maltose permease [Jaminaea rosea]
MPAAVDTTQAAEVARIDDKAQAKIASQVEDYNALVHDAAAVMEEEHGMTLWQTIKDHPTAIMWTILFSAALVMEGYDTMLLGNFFAQPTFARTFGTCNAAGDCEIPAPWQTGLSNGALVGEIIGLQIVGWVSEIFGYKRTMLFSLIAMTAFVFIPFFASSLAVLLVGQVLQGIPWGVFQTLTTTYAADIAPLQLRGVLTTYNNLCWVISQLIAQGVLRGCLSRTDKWAYKIPYALQWVWIPGILVACLFAPESPWFLVRKGRKEEAEKSLRRLSSRSRGLTSERAAAKINEMVLTAELEKQTESGATYLDCFKGTNLRRTEIGIMVYLTQVFCGAPLMGYSTYFFKQAGMSTENAFNMSIGLFAVGFVGTVSSWFVMQKVNRRNLFLWGQYAMCAILIIVGAIAAGAGEQAGAAWGIGALLLAFTFVYDVSVGPATYALVAEIPASQVRSKSVALSRNFYNIGGLIANTIQPRMLNPTSNIYIGARSGFVWAGPCALFALWTFFRLPDPTGRTYLELDALFEAKVPARKFRSTRLELFGSNQASLMPRGNSQDEKASTDEKSSGVEHSTLGYQGA